MHASEEYESGEISYSLKQRSGRMSDNTKVKKVFKSASVKNGFKTIFYIVIAIMIPGLLILNAIQAERYMKIQREVEELEKKQIKLVEENKKLITDISLLSSAQRIGNIAENELDMHKAETEEIVRVEMNKKSESK